MKGIELARILKEQLNFLKNENAPLDVYLLLLNRFTTSEIMGAIPFFSRTAKEVLDTDDFWRVRWLSDFADQVSDIGPQLPIWIENVEHPKVGQLSREIMRLKQLVVLAVERNSILKKRTKLINERNEYLASPYLEWKKYWLWTYFFRRTLTRGIGNTITQKLLRSNQNAGQTGTYYISIVPGRDSLISIQGGEGDLVVTYDVWSLVPLFDHWNESWTDEAFARFLPKGPAPDGMRPGNFGLPFACALIILKIAGINAIFRRIFLPRTFGVRRSGFATEITTRNLQADARERDDLAQTYLDWYLYKTLEAVHVDPSISDGDKNPKSKLVRLVGGDVAIEKFQEFFNYPGQDRGNPVLEWTNDLRIILNEPRVGVNPRAGQNVGPDEQSKKIFLGAACVATTCAACGSEASQQCKRCKSVLYCGKECQTSHWSAEHKDLCVPSSKFSSETKSKTAAPIGHNFEDEKPTIKVNNWDHEFAAERLLDVKGKKEAIKHATQRMDDAEVDGDRALLVYWWWVVKLLKEESFERPWPVPRYTKKMPSVMRYMTYKEWAEQAYNDTKERDGDTPKTRGVRVREARVNLRRLVKNFRDQTDPDRGFYWWVDRELASYLTKN